MELSGHVNGKGRQHNFVGLKNENENINITA